MRLKQIKKIMIKQITIISKYYKNMMMIKCPKCQQKGFEKNILKKDFIRKTVVYKSTIDEMIFTNSNLKFIDNRTQEKVEVNVYNVKYLCKNCNYVIEQERDDGKNYYGNLKILMSYDEYKKSIENIDYVKLIFN